MLLAFVSDVYTIVFELELNKRVEGNNTVILAMDAVKDVKSLKFASLKKLTLEEFEIGDDDFSDFDSEEGDVKKTDEWDMEDKLGDRFIDPGVYLQSLEKVMGVEERGKTIEILMKNSKTHNIENNGRFFEFIKLRYVQLFCLMVMFLSPITVNLIYLTIP